MSKVSKDLILIFYTNTYKTDEIFGRMKSVEDQLETLATDLKLNVEKLNKSIMEISNELLKFAFNNSSKKYILYICILYIILKIYINVF